jgi:hypothetical protein
VAGQLPHQRRLPDVRAPDEDDLLTVRAVFEHVRQEAVTPVNADVADHAAGAFFL